MNRRTAHLAGGWKLRSATRSAVRCAGWTGFPLLFLASVSVAQVSLPAEWRGDWVVGGHCGADARLRVDGDRLTLIHGEDQETFGDVWIASSYFGPDYTGISRVVVPEINAENPPFMVTFNPDEQAGVARVDIYDAPPGAINPAYREVLEAARRRAERFPIDHQPLTRCPGSDEPASPTGDGS